MESAKTSGSPGQSHHHISFFLIIITIRIAKTKNLMMWWTKISISPDQAAQWPHARGTALRGQTLDGSRPSWISRLPIGWEHKIEASDLSLGVSLLPQEHKHRTNPVYTWNLLCFYLRGWLSLYSLFSSTFIPSINVFSLNLLLSSLEGVKDGFNSTFVFSFLSMLITKFYSPCKCFNIFLSVTNAKF